MIRSFDHKGLEVFFLTGSRRGIQARHEGKLRRILTRLDAAVRVEDMDLPAFRLHPLKGRRKDYWSVTVQANWRVTFRFRDGDAEVVNYEDYH